MFALLDLVLFSSLGHCEGWQYGKLVVALKIHSNKRISALACKHSSSPGESPSTGSGCCAFVARAAHMVKKWSQVAASHLLGFF